MDLNLAHAQIAARKKLLEDVSPLQIVAPTKIKDHHQDDQSKDQTSSAVRSADSLTKSEAKRVLDRFQPLTPLLKTALEGAHALRQGFQDLKNLTRDQTEPPIVAASPVTSNQPISSTQSKGQDSLITSPVTHPEQTVVPQPSKTAGTTQAKATEKSGQPAKAENLPAGGHVQPPLAVGGKAPEATNDRPRVNAQAIHLAQPGKLVSLTRPEGKNSPAAPPVNHVEPTTNSQSPKTTLRTQAQATENLERPAKPENLPAGGHIQPPLMAGEKAPEPERVHPALNTQAVHPPRPGQSIPPMGSERKDHLPTPKLDRFEHNAVPPESKHPISTQTQAADKLGQLAKAENLPAGSHAQTPSTVEVKTPEAIQSHPVIADRAIQPVKPGQPISSVKPEGEKRTASVNRSERSTISQQSKTSLNIQSQVTDKSGQPAKAEDLPAGGPALTPSPVGVKAPEAVNDRPGVNVQAIGPTQSGQPISPTQPKGQNQPITSPVDQPEQTLAPQPSKTAVTTQTQATEKSGQPAKAENLPAGGHVQAPLSVGVKAPDAAQDHSGVNAQAIRPTQPGQTISPTQTKGESRPIPPVNHPEQTAAHQQSKTDVTTQSQTTGKLGQPAKAENLPPGGPVQAPPPVGVKTPEATNDRLGVNVQAIRPIHSERPIFSTQPKGEDQPSGVQAVGGEQKVPSRPGGVGKENQVLVGTRKQLADHENVPAGGNPQVPVAVTPRFPQTPEKSSGIASQAVLPVQEGQAIQPGKVETNTLASASKRTGEHRTISAQTVNLPVNIPLEAEKAVPPPSVLSTEPPISAIPGVQGPMSSVAQSQIQGTRPLVIPPGAPVGGELIATGLTKSQAIQTFQLKLREAGARTTIEEARKTRDLLQQHPLVNAQPVVLTTPQTLIEKVGSTDETVTRLSGPVSNRPNLGAEIVARTPVRGDNRASTEPIGKAERREMGPQNGSRLPARPPAHAVPPLLNVNSQLRQPLPTNAHSRLVAIPTVNLLDLSL